MYYGAYQRFLMSPFNSNDLDFHLVFISFVSPDGKTLVLVNPQAISLHTNVLECNPQHQKWQGLYLKISQKLTITIFRSVNSSGPKEPSDSVRIILSNCKDFHLFLPLLVSFCYPCSSSLSTSTSTIITCSSLCLMASRSCLASWASASLLFRCSMLLWIVPTCKVVDCTNPESSHHQHQHHHLLDNLDMRRIVAVLVLRSVASLLKAGLCHLHNQSSVQLNLQKIHAL